MESFTNYPDTELEVAHSQGYEIVMTPRLDAEVSCVYFGWSPPEDVFFNPMKFPPLPAKVCMHVLCMHRREGGECIMQ